jgi:hypothetical protein
VDLCDEILRSVCIKYCIGLTRVGDFKQELQTSCQVLDFAVRMYMVNKD